MMLRFTPPKQVARYAAFIDHGNGRGFFKTYDEVGPAKVALRMQLAFGSWRDTNLAQYNAKLLEMIDGEWFTLYDIPKGTTRLPWEKEVETYSAYHGRFSKRWQAVPMTRDEYGEFRAKVERERLNLALAGNPS